MTVQRPNSFRSGPDEHGHFGIYGGRFVAETLMPLILELEQAYAQAKADPAFQKEMDGYLTHYVGRPSPLYFAERLTAHCRQTASGLSGGGAQRSISSARSSTTPARTRSTTCSARSFWRGAWARKRIIAETGAGMHGVATATLCARFGLECIVYMGAVDVERQKANVFRMHMLGAKVVPVESGAKTLKDAMNEALRDWVTNVGSTFYCIGTIAGPHPYPMMVRDFQSIIGRETPRADARGRRPAAGFADRLHRRRLERHGPVPSVPRRAAESRFSASRRPATASIPACTPPRSPAAGPACCTAIALIC